MCLEVLCPANRVGAGVFGAVSYENRRSRRLYTWSAALLARCRDLTALRYDFPLVLARGVADKDSVQCLSAIVDEVVHRVAGDDNAERVTRHLLRLEREIRVLIAGGARGTLAALWDDAAAKLAGSDASLEDSLKRGRKALKVDGVLADCDESLPALMLKHAWGVVREKKTRRLGEDLRRLTIGLSNILRADAAPGNTSRFRTTIKYRKYKRLAVR